MKKEEKINMENEAIFEIIQDFIFLYFLVMIESETDDAELRSLLDSVNGFLISVFSHELINSKYCNKEEFEAADLAVVRSIRTSYLKNPPKANGKLINELKDSTGVDFKYFAFDCVVTVDKSNSNDLICINFSDFVVHKFYKSNTNVFNQISRLPATVINAFFKGLGVDYSELYDRIKPISKNAIDSWKQKFSFKRYAYSTFLMFKNSKLTNEEKYFILYRYNLIKFALIIKELQPLSINIIETIPINTDITYRKIKALAIETIYNDIKALDLPITQKIKRSLSYNINNMLFFSTNRKMRNNIHYNKKEEISEEELALLDKYQDVYLNTVLDVFNENINVSINKNYRFWKWISEKTDSNFKEKAKKSGYNFMKFKDIFNDNY